MQSERREKLDTEMCRATLTLRHVKKGENRDRDLQSERREKLTAVPQA